jgi:deoxyribodipyrimidine photolyase-related protein
MHLFLLFPVNLFSNIEKLKNKKIYLIEEPRFFTDFIYHKLKIAYHRATMKSYYYYLLDQKIDVTYFDFKDINEEFYKNLIKNFTKIYTYNPCDNILLNKLNNYIGKSNIIIEETLNFLVSEKFLEKNIDTFFKNGKYSHQNFYKMQRLRLNILIKNDGLSPIGGKWSFDTENRKKLPKNIEIPEVLKLKYINNKFIVESKEYCNKYFLNNYGTLDNFIYPINHIDTIKWLNDFLKRKFENFGIYEDAESERDPFLFHSVLSPMMNIGLITDKEVLEIVLKYENKVPIESFEGFIRQIIGWRNYLYAIYLLEGDKLKKYNFLGCNNKINKQIMWEGKTDIIPIDNVIKKINDYGYAHHIERLMYLGNYMLICMINPNDVYELFMEWTIDAYEWVMVPNVYGMSQFSDGGIVMTRPYFSSSNYILKMSDYKKSEWCGIYDALYYNFINNNIDFLKKNYATSRQVAFWLKKNESDKKEIIKISKKYLDKYLL